MKELGYTEIDYDLVIESPGRINIIGEHTDYNNGFVLPTAINKKIQFKFKKNHSENSCKVFSNNFSTSFSFDLRTIGKSEHQWENYILGVIYEIQQLSDGIEGFDCVLESNIPIGSGISSSAALECGLAFGLNELFDLGLSKITLVEIGQRAEHNYVGTKCGIMDQFASVMSKEGYVILLDCQSLDFEYVPINIEPYTLLLLNTNVSHNLADGEYNKRRSECEEGVSIIRQKYPLVKSLRDVSIGMINEFKSDLSEVIYKRCVYVINEKYRVLKSVEALKNKDLKELGGYMYETHEGLQNNYEVSCPELDFLVENSKNYSRILGARMMGGGFGGCTINLIHSNDVEQFVEGISKAYFEKFKIKLSSFEAMPSEGTSIKQL